MAELFIVDGTEVLFNYKGANDETALLRHWDFGNAVEAKSKAGDTYFKGVIDASPVDPKDRYRCVRPDRMVALEGGHTAEEILAAAYCAIKQAIANAKK